MRWTVSVALLSVSVGYLLGGRLRNFGGLRLRWWGLAPLGLIMQLLPPSWWGNSARQVSLVLLDASYPLLIVFALRNVRLAGFPLILIGLVLNLAVISVNNGMPVSCDALVASGQGELCAELKRESGLKHHLLGRGDDLTVLADVIPIGAPVNQVVSLGDLVAYAGLAWLMIASMSGRSAFLPHRRDSAGAS